MVSDGFRSGIQLYRELAGESAVKNYVLFLPLLAIASPAYADPLDVTLTPVSYNVARTDTVMVHGTLYNPGSDSLYLNGVGNELPSLLGGEAAGSDFLSLGPQALAPGESW